ncbi:MAG: hypothetical protein LC676_10645 [Loktanella sp.]|nr:hypothetical protein [Loktanella sp.]
MAIFALYCAPGDWRDAVIRTVTRSRYSHVEMLRAPPSLGEALCISASKRDGNRVREAVIRFKPDHWEFLRADWLDPEEAYARAAEHIGAPYDAIGAVLTVTPFARHRSGRWFCSELLGYAAGLTDPHLLTPGRLANRLREAALTDGKLHSQTPIRGIERNTL